MKSTVLSSIVAAASVLLAQPATAQTVVDGDTIKVDGVTFRICTDMPVDFRTPGG
jgi:hypothetical protein